VVLVACLTRWTGTVLGADPAVLGRSTRPVSTLARSKLRTRNADVRTADPEQEAQIVAVAVHSGPATSADTGSGHAWREANPVNTDVTAWTGAATAPASVGPADLSGTLGGTLAGAGCQADFVGRTGAATAPASVGPADLAGTLGDTLAGAGCQADFVGRTGAATAPASVGPADLSGTLGGTLAGAGCQADFVGRTGAATAPASVGPADLVGTLGDTLAGAGCQADFVGRTGAATAPASVGPADLPRTVGQGAAASALEAYLAGPAGSSIGQRSPVRCEDRRVTLPARVLPVECSRGKTGASRHETESLHQQVGALTAVADVLGT
jgi:hypothetical protein